MSDSYKTVASSGTLINCYNNRLDVSHLTECPEMTTANKLHCHVKIFNMITLVDALVESANFPEHDATHDE